MWSDIAPAAVVVLIPIAAMIGFGACLRFPVPARWALCAAGAAICLCAPVLVLSMPPLVRGIAAVWCGTTAVRLWGLCHRPPKRRLGIVEVLAFLASPFSLAMPEGKGCEFPPRPSVRLLRGAALTVGGGTSLFLAFRWFGADSSFAIEHSVKAVSIFLLIWGIADLLYAPWRALGFTGRPMMKNFVLARTPAEFWRRYNIPVHEFFRIHVAGRPASRSRLMLSTLHVFVISGLIHEYIAWVAVGAVQGYQTAFFLLQGLAVVLTQPLHPRGVWAAAGVISTLAFNLITSVLFFATVDQMVEWYAAGG